MIERLATNIIFEYLKLGKIVYLVGARQVGKTTLAKMIMPRLKQPVLFLSGDDMLIAKQLSNASIENLKQLTARNKSVIIDEAHLIDNIGRTLKLMYDHLDIQIIATGSSSIELTDKISQPLTGRKFDVEIYPLSFVELAKHRNYLAELSLLEHRMIYGFYPEVVTKPGYEYEILKLLIKEYLLKDIFRIGSIKKPHILDDLLTALALQVGQEVSYSELSRLLGVDKETIMRYIYLLEQAYIIFKLPAFSRNLRSEIRKTKKIYFYDNGIRNAIINNFNPLNKRNDVGALWENFLITERLKMLKYSGRYVKTYFWRTKGQAEVDYIEEENGQLRAYELKWSRSRKSKPKTFTQTYGVEIKIITRDNFIEFINLTI